MWRFVAILLAILGVYVFCIPVDTRYVTVRDTTGKTVRPLEARNKRAVLLFFLAHDCPIANTYAPEIARIYAAYEPRGVACYVVYVEPGLPAATARKHAREYGLRCQALLDPTHRLVKAAGATVTPEAAVFRADGALAYRGRIDDRYLDFGKWRFKPEHRDLRTALNAIIKNEPVKTPRTRAIGCFIQQLP